MGFGAGKMVLHPLFSARKNCFVENGQENDFETSQNYFEADKKYKRSGVWFKIVKLNHGVRIFGLFHQQQVHPPFHKNRVAKKKKIQVHSQIIVLLDSSLLTVSPSFCGCNPSLQSYLSSADAFIWIQ